MANQWYYAQAGQQRGPVSADDLQRLVATGQVRGEDLVWSEGMANWAPASSVPELRSLAAPQPQAPAPAPAPEPAPMPMADTTPVQYQSAQPPAGVTGPKNYLVPSILVTVCCCLPFGIVAIIHAAHVNSKFQVGDYAGAEESSRKAKFWTWLSFGTGLVLGVLIALWLIVAGPVNP